MLPRCGRVAHICGANYFATSSPCCNCTFLKLSNSQLIIFMKQVANSDKATGQLQHTGRQKQGWNPLLPDVEDRFPWKQFRMFPVKHFVATVPPEQLQDTCFLFRFHKAGRSCSPRLEKLSLFSPPPPCAKSMARGFRCLRAAIRATRPHLASIFEKLLDQKTF